MICDVLSVCAQVVYFSMERFSLFMEDLILFWASMCVIPSVLTPSMAEMTSPWAMLPPAALLPAVIYRGVNRGGHTTATDTDSFGDTHKLVNNTNSHKNTHFWVCEAKELLCICTFHCIISAFMCCRKHHIYCCGVVLNK